jgi:hypothetical protein
MTTHNTHNRQTSTSPAGFEPTISAGERPQTHAFYRAAGGIGHGYLMNVNWQDYRLYSTVIGWNDNEESAEGYWQDNTEVLEEKPDQVQSDPPKGEHHWRQANLQVKTKHILHSNRLAVILELLLGYVKHTCVNT